MRLLCNRRHDPKLRSKCCNYACCLIVASNEVALHAESQDFADRTCKDDYTYVWIISDVIEA